MTATLDLPCAPKACFSESFILLSLASHVTILVAAALIVKFRNSNVGCEVEISVENESATSAQVESLVSLDNTVPEPTTPKKSSSSSASPRAASPCRSPTGVEEEAMHSIEAFYASSLRAEGKSMRDNVWPHDERLPGPDSSDEIEMKVEEKLSVPSLYHTEATENTDIEGEHMAALIAKLEAEAEEKARAAREAIDAAKSAQVNIASSSPMRQSSSRAIARAESNLQSMVEI